MWRTGIGEQILKSVIAKTFFAVLAVAAMSSSAQATMTWTDDYTPGTQLITPDSPAIYDHDLTLGGFNPLTDTVQSLTLTIDLFANDIVSFLTGRLSVDAGSNYSNLNFVFGDGIYDETFNAQASASMLDDGILHVEIFASLKPLLSGLDFDPTFTLTGSHLVATGTRSSVPEPGTLGLLGLGLLGIAAGSRRKVRN